MSKPDPFMVVRTSAIPDFADAMPVMVDAATRQLFEAACRLVRPFLSNPAAADENECLRAILNCYVTERTNNDPETGTD